MTFWSAKALSRLLDEKGIICTYDPESKTTTNNFDPGRIDSGAYNLRVGREAIITLNITGDGDSHRRKLRLDDGEIFAIPAGQFAHLLTEEYLKMPKDAIGFISLSTRYKIRGLINVSGFHVDPGFEGHLIYSVFNAGPDDIPLERGKNLFKIWFADLDDKNCKPLDDVNVVGNYYWEKEPQKEIPNEYISSREVISLQSLKKEIDGLKLSHLVAKTAVIVVATTIGVFISIFGALVGIKPFQTLVENLLSGS